MSKTRVIAFYLPQYHPTPENDEWWGKGFTEWTNVAKGTPLFRGHYQPKIPSELGFYDLRLPEVRKAQAEMAKDAGVEGFCYWHYWFGGGKQLLNMPLEEVVRLGEPDFPFCLGWANHKWMKKAWSKDVSRLNMDLLMEQTYPGKEDVDLHFRTMLPMFKDKRYMRIDNRLVFLIYEPHTMPDMEYFVNRWQELARDEGLGGFYFIGQIKSDEEFKEPAIKLMDAVNYECLFSFFRWTRFKKIIATILHRAMRKNYSRILKEYDLGKIKPGVFPSIYPNWDNTPRKGYAGAVFQNSTPKLFEKHARQIIDATPENKDGEKIVFLKSWNEWAEGNYMEPDLRYGRGYIEALRRVVDETSN